ncbi:MAG: hypothetical protein BIFFINMI_02239 [Phycisphaerae bacterium]|nr:hypothetical protein [Phycisphaerae bacterium]
MRRLQFIPASIVIALLAAASPLAAQPAKPKFAKAPGANLRDAIIWGAECRVDDNRGLAFGGCDQAADDGAAHTRILKAGQWVDIHEDLRKANPLQADHDKLCHTRDAIKDAKARVRFVFFEGAPSADQVKAIASDALPALKKAVTDLLDQGGTLNGYKPNELADRGKPAGQFVGSAQIELAHVVERLAEAAPSVEDVKALDAVQIAAERAAELLDCEPAPRALSPIVYDKKTKLFVLFGGDHLDYMTNDTWVFAPATNRWEQRHPKTAPPPRANHTLASNEDGKITLSGGFTHNNIDIWYMGPLYQLRDDGDWVYDIEQDTWTSKAGTAGIEPDQRAYRTGAFVPEFFMQGDKPDRAANEAKLKALPVNTWVVMNPPYKPRVNRDWGSACTDPDRDVLLRWSGGHCAHGGSDVPMYHYATNRWELTFPVEFPLGQCYSNTSYPGGFNFNRRPWVSGHTYKNFGYDPVDKLMVFTGHNPWSYLFDPAVGDWIGRTRKPNLMNYNGSFYTLTLCTAGQSLYAWCGQYGQSVGLTKWNAKDRNWDVVKVTGENLPGPECDHSGLAYDAKRDRLIFFPKKYSGALFAMDCKTNVLSKLTPAGSADAPRQIGFWRELAYLPDADWIVVAGSTLAAEGGENEVRPTLAYDCANNKWLSLTIGGPSPAGKGGRNVSQGTGYDAERGLIWATDTNSEVFVLRLDAANVTKKEL